MVRMVCSRVAIFREHSLTTATFGGLIGGLLKIAFIAVKVFIHFYRSMWSTLPPATGLKQHFAGLIMVLPMRDGSPT